MSQALAEREADIARFRDAFKGEVAPEFTKPLVWSTPDGKKESPFELIKLGKEDPYGEVKAIFEAKNDESGQLVKVDYTQSSGLKLKRQLYLSGEDLISGEVAYNFGEVQIVLGAGYFAPMLLHPLCVKDQLADMESFRAGISVIKANTGPTVPRLALMEYGSNSQIPLNAEFPMADYEDAKNGTYEMRKGRFDEQPTYQTTYFQWENLVGAKVGATRFKEEGDHTHLGYYRWVTKINNSGLVQIEGTPYASKISHSRDRRRWGEGRLRFSRKNINTGEAWMFSVPEWLDKKRFVGDLESQSLSDFRWQYPVIFCVKRPGQEREWLSTLGKRDLPR